MVIKKLDLILRDEDECSKTLRKLPDRLIIQNVRIPTGGVINMKDSINKLKIH